MKVFCCVSVFFASFAGTQSFTPTTARSQACTKRPVRESLLNRFANNIEDDNSDDDDDNDDGWGDSSSLEGKASELRKLQQERTTPTSSISSRTSRTSSSSAFADEDRDLFIPIFALVSLAGLFGSYGYEMLRLYSRGELYLPWGNH